MKELDLNEYSDKQIVAALFNLDAIKFVTVMNVVGGRVQKAQARADAITREDIDKQIQKLSDDIEKWVGL